tara:strand:- start:621 stop:1058 length:438 start_codon:yes stop_codon:yes gene_type:complete
MILLRLAMGVVAGTTFAILGYAIGWILALSVPEGIPRIPILIAMTSVGATAGTFLAWHFNIDGDSFPNGRLVSILLLLTIVASIVGGTIGHNYGAEDSGHRVRRYPEIQGTLWGTVGAANLMQIACYAFGIAIGLASKKNESVPK